MVCYKIFIYASVTHRFDIGNICKHVKSDKLNCQVKRQLMSIATYIY